MAILRNRISRINNTMINTKISRIRPVITIFTCIDTIVYFSLILPETPELKLALFFLS